VSLPLNKKQVTPDEAKTTGRRELRFERFGRFDDHGEGVLSMGE
jgi:hypothetical protein